MHSEHGSSFDDENEGYFLVSRKLRHSEIFLNPPMLQMLLFCIDAAAFKPQRVPMRTGATLTYVDLKVGQFITGRNSGAKELCIPPATFWDRLKKLEATGVVVITSNSHFSVVTVCNYSRYQNAKKSCRQRKQQGSVTASQQPGDSPVTTGQQPGDTKKEFNKELFNEVSNEIRNKAGPDAFERFWDAYPSYRKSGKGAAETAFAKACRMVDAETIIAAALEYAASPVGQGEYVKGPTPWLNQRCWEDDRSSWNRKDTSNANRNQPTAGQVFSGAPIERF
jgi:hypothetical protein